MLSETSLNAKNLALRGSACRTAEPSLLCFWEAAKLMSSGGEIFTERTCVDLCAGVEAASQQYWNLQSQKSLVNTYQISLARKIK